MIRRPSLALLAACLLLGCGDEDDGADPPAPAATPDAGRAADAATMPDAAVDGAIMPMVDAGLSDPPAPSSDFVLEMGLGDRTFVPVVTGDEAPLQRGCQGAQHVWISLRSPDLGPGDLTNTLRAVRVRDGEEVVPAHMLVLPWDPADAGAELIGVTLVMFDPVAVVGELVDLQAEVEASDGRVGRAVIRVVIEWGPDAC